MKLTHQQEKFCQEVANGKSGRQAYYVAYPKSKLWKDTAVDTQASILNKNSKVIERIQELKKKETKKFIKTKEDLLKELDYIKKFSLKKVGDRLSDGRLAVQCIDKQATMLGYNIQVIHTDKDIEKIEFID